MYEAIKPLHSYFAWAVLFVVAVAVVLAGAAFISGQNRSNQKAALFAMIAAHIQLLLGLILYFVSPQGMDNLSSAAMKDPFARLLAVEHPLTNIIAIVLITLGYSRAKKMASNAAANKTLFIFYGIALLLLLSRIPWAAWLGL